MYILIIGESTILDFWYKFNAEIFDVPLGAIFSIVIPFVVELWYVGLLESVALLISPVILVANVGREIVGLLSVSVPVAAPTFIAVAAPKALIVVAVSFSRANVVDGVVMLVLVVIPPVNTGATALTGAPVPVAVVHTGKALAPPPTRISVAAPAASV